ncbi:RadC family protein [Lonsdalea populi]|uniref:RadC family protein n=1 Tax=Lonsdalea TaxID=1082702 RepID=UPI003F61F944
MLEAARQAIDLKMQRGAEFTSPALVKEYLRNKMASFEHEVFAVLFLDTRHRLIEYREMFHGTIDSTSVYPREVVKEALRINAAAVIFSHNHPSGNPEPSHADKVLTQRLKEVLTLVEVRTLDHVMVTGANTASFTERGLIQRRSLGPFLLKSRQHHCPKFRIARLTMAILPWAERHSARYNRFPLGINIPAAALTAGNGYGLHSSLSRRVPHDLVLRRRKDHANFEGRRRLQTARSLEWKRRRCAPDYP